MMIPGLLTQAACAPHHFYSEKNTGRVWQMDEAHVDLLRRWWFQDFFRTKEDIFLAGWWRAWFVSEEIMRHSLITRSWSPSVYLETKGRFLWRKFWGTLWWQEAGRLHYFFRTKAFLLEEMSRQAFDFSLKNGWPGIAAGRAHYIFRWEWCCAFSEEMGDDARLGRSSQRTVLFVCSFMNQPLCLEITNC